MPLTQVCKTIRQPSMMQKQSYEMTSKALGLATFWD